MLSQLNLNLLTIPLVQHRNKNNSKIKLNKTEQFWFLKDQRKHFKYLYQISLAKVVTAKTSLQDV